MSDSPSNGRDSRPARDTSNRRDTRGDDRRDDRRGNNRDDRPRSFDNDRPRSRDDQRGDNRDRPRSNDDRPRFRDDNRRDDRPRSRDDQGGDNRDRPRSNDDRPRFRDDNRRDDRPRSRDDQRGDNRDRPRSNDDRPRFRDDNRRDDRPRSRDDQRGDNRDRPRSNDDRPRFRDDNRRDDRPRFNADRGDRPRFSDKPRFRDDNRRDDNRRDGDAPRKGVMDYLRETDLELLRLLVRRTRLREKLSEKNAGGKERDLRTHWEENASRCSRDPRLLRDLFILLQQIDVNPAEADSPQAFNLAPTPQPVRVDLPVAASTRQTRMRMALAAGGGVPCVLQNVLLNAQVISCLKMFNQVGSALRWEENPDRVECTVAPGTAGNTKTVLDKVIHVGDDPFNLYLLLFQMLTRPARVKIMGESALRFENISALRRFLPALGGRLTSVVPGEDGLPARLESSSILPASVAVPADIPADAVLALLLATPFWGNTVRVDLEARPDVDVDEVVLLLRAAGCTVEDTGVVLTITPPARVALPDGDEMDLLAAFPLLAYAGCSGGTSTVRGRWPLHHPNAVGALHLLRCVSTVDISSDAVTATALPAADDQPLADFLLTDLPLDLAGPGLALYLHSRRALDSCPMPALPEGVDPDLVDGFLAVLGYARTDGTLSKVEPVRVPWAAPSVWWAVALVLASFGFPKLRLSNPGIVSSLVPQFWTVFNSLPEPTTERARPDDSDAPSDDAPARRRVRAGFMPESEMPPALDLYTD